MTLSKIKYYNKDSDTYKRFYSNLSFTQQTPQSEVVIDFFEEYMGNYLLEEQNLDENQQRDVYNRPDDQLDIHRIRNCTVTMPKEQALRLARYILENFGE